MKQLLTILLLTNFIGFGQKIDSYVTDDFRNKPQTVIIFVAVADDVDENRRIATNIKKLLPETITVKKILAYNKAWVKSYDEMIFDESLKVGAMAVIKVIAVDAEQRSNLSLQNNTLFGYQYQATKYECTLEYSQTQLVLWKGVSKFRWEGCPYVKFIRQAVKDGVL